jgi:predicted DNA-binding protein (UPF0251 family)
MAVSAGEFKVLLQLSRKPATDDEENAHRNIAAALLEGIALHLEAGEVFEMFIKGVLLGSVLRRTADWPVLAVRLKQLRNKRAAASEARARNAKRARELLAAVKKEAGLYFNRTDAIKIVAKKMEVHPRTVGRWLNNSKGQD